MKPSPLIRQALAGVAVVTAATLLNRLILANTVSAGFVYLLAVMSVAIWQGFFAGALGSLLATACFNFFFIPPVGTFHVADPQNWIALACFLITTTVASRLVVRERERAAEAESRQREIAALYDLCLDLFTASTKPGGLDAATSRALRTIGAHGGGLVLAPEGRTDLDPGSWVGGPTDLEVHRLLGGDAAAVSGITPAPGAAIFTEDGPVGRLEGETGAEGAASPERPRGPAGRSGEWRNVRIPVLVEGRVVGILVTYGTRAKQETLESVGKLIGLAFERERLLAEQNQVEALKASDSLKTSLLRAVSHDLSTPLTAILLSLESLKRHADREADLGATVDLIVEEATRLNRRIQNLLTMARLEAHGFAPRREPVPAADLFRSARENLPLIASSRPIEAHVSADCPDLDVDPSLALEILVNLIENAHRASGARAAIELLAIAHPSDPSRVRLEVLDRGEGLPGSSRVRLGGTDREGDSVSGREVPRNGLGLEIARSFAAAHDGCVMLVPREGGGVRAQIDLPADRRRA